MTLLMLLKISEVVNSMKDVMHFCREHKIGPIEGLKNYPRHGTAAKLQMQKLQEMEQLAGIQGAPTDRNTLNQLMTLHPGLNSQMGNDHHMAGRGALSGSAQAALALRYGNNNSAATAASGNGQGSVMGPTPSRNNSFKAASHSDSSAAGGNNGFNQKESDLPQNLHLSEEMVQDIAHDFTKNGFFNSDLEDNMSYGWKA
ncbi:hypothetical protein F0562_026575 [Nyssa sinensis]|uniref:Uncharacterized protein n=1 Tax=Nyssa sinensis TaxID=561372 RepID=A0A5J5B9R4_9ASTE|nr:hypothetical protein F0562_026575 [Nyssa sinensis]